MTKICRFNPLVLNILGIGTAVGQTALKKADFDELGIPECSLTPSSVRYSSLNKEYLKRTKNSDINAVRNDIVQIGATDSHSINQSPTDICLSAAKAAIAQAGISAEQIGLVIGDCPTPWQTTPAEGQRVADKLGLKIPAYDIAGGGIVPQHLSSLASWRTDRVPEYTLLVCGSIPTARMSFKDNGPERWQFSDTAAACVISSKHRGKLLVKATENIFHGGGTKAFAIDQYLPIVADLEILSSELERLSSEVLAKAIFKHKLHGSRVVLCCGEASLGMAQRIGEAHSISRIASVFEGFGQTLSSGCFFSYQQVSSSLKSGDVVIMLQALPGFVSGYAICEVL